MADKLFKVPYPVELDLRVNCPRLTPGELDPAHKFNRELVLRRPLEPAESKLVYTVVDHGEYLLRLMTNTQPPRVIDISASGLEGLCRRADLLLLFGLYESLVLTKLQADTALEKFLRPTSK